MNLINANAEAAKAARARLKDPATKAALVKKMKARQRQSSIIAVIMVFLGAIVSMLVLVSLVIWPVVFVAFIFALFNGNWLFFFVCLIIAVVTHIIGAGVTSS